MKLILIDGGPASGKNTLGSLLVDEFYKLGNKAKLLDLDSYIEEFNPKWIWENEQQKEKDQLNARINFTKDIDKHLRDNFTVIAVGERFLTNADTFSFIGKLEMNCNVYLYHLSIPYALREQRLHKRGRHSLINLAMDQKDRDAVRNWPGYVYENTNTPEVDALKILKLIQKEKGLINSNHSQNRS